MTRIYDTFLAGGLVMWPLLGLFVVTLACILERSWFWLKLLIQEKQVVRGVLTEAKIDLEKAEKIAASAQNLAIGRFLVEPLRLKKPSPETFHLAIKAAYDKESVAMRKGDMLLESVVAIAPLLAILGTANGLITTFTNLKTNSLGITDFATVTSGIAQALISSTTGIAVAIFAFVFFRIFLCLQSWQKGFFSQVGNELELIYLQFWHEPSNQASTQIKNDH
ncbi:MotA/TolQ/ExbB proton channel family protein [Mastigocladopsis repens]|uniref:MotA/TolQ/ExbB proton channel family protein n=1 Tax=Mastigocladopsis repens TaxID=221287 RepID=UPI0004749D91|nr:MotA/TolQ/ExbB proton channel family protein [Mastigocladopsis repens]